MAEVKALAEQYTSIVQDLDAAREDIARHNEGPCGSVTEDACQSTLAQQVGQIQDLTMAVATLEETQHTLDTEVAASKSEVSCSIVMILFTIRTSFPVHSLVNVPK